MLEENDIASNAYKPVATSGHPSVRLNTRWALAGQGTIAVCQLLQLVVLARLLTASEIGLGAMFIVLVSAGQIFWDFGTSAAIIQRRRVDQDELSTLHLLNIALGCIFAILLWTAAPSLAGALGRADATSLFRWAAAVPLVSALGGQFRALHLRNMHFRAIATIDIAAAIISCVAAITAAIAGLGSLAFAAAAVSGAATNVFLLICSGAHMRARGPSWNPRGLAHFVRFGAYQTGSSFIAFVHINLDIVLLAGLLNPLELGMYAFAKQMCVRPLELLYPVILRGILPQLARLQDDTEALRKHFLAVYSAINLVLAPLFIALIISAHDLIPIVFGEKWEDAVVVFQVLAVAHLLRFLMVPTSVSMMATGRVTRAFHWDAGFAALLVLTIITLRPSSALSMATILVIAYAVALIPHWRVTVAPTLKLGLARWLSASARPIAVSIVAAAGTWFIVRSVNAPTVRLATFLGAGLACYCLLSFLLNRSALRAVLLLGSQESRQLRPMAKPGLES